MRVRSAAAGIACVLALLGVRAGAQESPGERIYQQNCAGCHGIDLRGGQARSLVDAVWQFGSQRSHIARNIRHGVADFAMPAFGEVLSDAQIEQVLDFILAAEKRAGARRPEPPRQIQTLDYEIDLEVVARGLDLPWSIAFPDARTALVTERPGRLRRIVDGELLPGAVKGTPEVLAEGQGGLLDVAVDPAHADEGWIYLAYSHLRRGAGTAMTRLVRGRLRGDRWTDEQVVYEAPPGTYVGRRPAVHFGSRIVFDPAGRLYFSIGERGRAEQAQDPARPNGKVHRIERDGSIPPDNPLLGHQGALPTLFTLGNRNAQGLAVHPVTGRIWAAEHGPMGGDELNLLAPGRNYGWPTITYGLNYDGSPVSARTHAPGMEQPVLYWRPSIAVSGIDFVRGDLFARWRDRLLVGALKYEELRLLRIHDQRVLHQEIILKGAGRVRDVASGPDGAIWVVTNGPGTVLRLTPVRERSGG